MHICIYVCGEKERERVSYESAVKSHCNDLSLERGKKVGKWGKDKEGEWDRMGSYPLSQEFVNRQEVGSSMDPFLYTTLNSA